MSLLLITNPPTTLAVSSDWTDLVARSNANMLGHGLSIPIFTLTNWDGTTTKPQIAEGSIIEVGGSFYQADADTALTDEGGLSDGTVHIKLVPAGGGASVVPTLTNDSLPAWDANKAGWYDIADKFLPFEMTKASAVYTVKSEYIDQIKLIKYSTAGDLILPKVFIDTIAEKTTSAGITFLNVVKVDSISEKTTSAGVSVEDVLKVDTIAENTTDAGITLNHALRLEVNGHSIHGTLPESSIFGSLSSFIPNTGDQMLITGGIELSGSIYIVSRVQRTSSTTMLIYGMTVVGADQTQTIDSTTGTNVDVSFSW